MKKLLFVLITLTLAASLFASYSNPTPEEMINPTIISSPGIDDPCQITESQQQVQQIEQEIENMENSQKPPVYFAPLWADDLLVTNECALSPSRTTLAFDYDANGYIYVAILSRHTNSDTLYVFQSTDMGYTWTKGWEIHYGGSRNIISYDMKVQHSGTNPYIYTVLTMYNSTNDTVMDFRRLKVDMSTWDWYHFDATQAAYQNIREVKMDITDEANPHVYIVFKKNGSPSSLQRLSSANGGSSWTRGTITSSAYGHNQNFDVTAGPGSYAYIIYRNSSDVFRCGRYGSYFTSIQGWADASSSRPNGRYVVLVSARNTAYPGNHVYMVYQDGSGTSSTRAMITSSTNGGSSFSGTYFMVGNVFAIRPFIAFSWTNNAVTGLVTKPGSFDTLRYAYRPIQTGSWTSQGVVNQYAATGAITPQGNYVNTGVGGGIAAVYRQYGSNNIWYDRASHQNSVEEIVSNPIDNVNITINSNNLFCSVSLTEETLGKIEIFDLSGRSVQSVYNGLLQKGENDFSLDRNNISTGSYILYVSTPFNTISEKFTVLR